VIVDIPTSEEFIANGEGHLNAAWGQVVDLLLALKEIRLAVPEGELNEADEEKYWASGGQTVAMSVASVQHGVEAVLKGRIAAISPYVLLAGPPSNWPRACDRQDSSFAEFRTVDAQDLLKLHNTVSVQRLSENFQQWFEKLRKDRNKAIHSVSNKLRLTAKDSLHNILEAHEYLFGAKQWLSARAKYLDLIPDNSIRYFRNEGTKPYISYALAREFTVVAEELGDQSASRFFGYMPKLDAYCCPKCIDLWEQRDFHDSQDVEEVSKTFQRTEIGEFQCVLCGYSCVPRFSNCDNEEGERLFDEASNRCLSCGAEQ